MRLNERIQTLIRIRKNYSEQVIREQYRVMQGAELERNRPGGFLEDEWVLVQEEARDLNYWRAIVAIAESEIDGN